MTSSLVQPRNLGFGCAQTLRPRRVPELPCFPSSSSPAAAATPPRCRFRSSSFRGAKVRASRHRGQVGGIAEEEASPELPVIRREQDDPPLAGEASEVSVAGDDWRWPPWKGLPQRYKLIGTTSLAFVICNMDKVGIGEGVSPSAATDIMARSIPREERSRAVGFVFGGLSVGSVLGLLLAPQFIQSLGWESVFYAFGFLGLAWCIGFQLLDRDQSSLHEHMLTGKRNMNTDGMPLASSAEKKSWDASLSQLNVLLKDVPWKAFFKSHAVWAMIYAHFCGSWGYYTCLSWLPTYFSEELSLNLTEAAWVSLLPPLASIAVTSIAATFADTLISNGVETTVVRKICQTIAFICPALSMAVASMDLGMSPWEIVAFLTAGLSLSSFALSGLYCTHQDISPEYASILLGITNTFGAVPGIVGVALTGYLLDQTHAWSMSQNNT